LIIRGSGNQPTRLSRCDAAAFESEFKEKMRTVESAIRSSREREQFGLLLLHRFDKLMWQLDQLESPLERMLWAELFARDLDRYLVPQVNVYDYEGKFIARVDFASTLLRIAVFTDGRTYHSSSEARARDMEQNERLLALGWKLRRYWMEDIIEELTAISDDIYQLVALRIAEMQHRGLADKGP
jgi:very-short-patch-repair endonuclease